MNSKLLFFDIDGTLLDCPRGIYDIPDEVKDAMDSLKERGHGVFLATGRTKCFILDRVMAYPFSGYVTCNGGYVEYKEEAIYKNVIPAEYIRIVHEYCVKHSFPYYLEGVDHIYTLDVNHPVHKVFVERWGMKPETVIDHYDPDAIETYIGMIVVNGKDDIPDMMEALSPYFDVQMHSSGISFDLTSKTSSKGKGIEELAKALHTDIKDTIAFGDGNNDIEMLQTAGIGIAMGNAFENAKKNADYITTNVEDHGIVNALKHFDLL